MMATTPLCDGHLDKLDGLNPARVLILQAYYALRRTSPPRQIGTRQIASWIQQHEPQESMPSDALTQLTLTQAKVPHGCRAGPVRTARRSAPPFVPGSSDAAHPATAVGTLLWPALLAEPLAQIATDIAAAPAPPSPAAASPPAAPKADLIEMQLGALTGRLMSSGGWVGVERRASADAVVDGPYAAL